MNPIAGHAISIFKAQGVGSSEMEVYKEYNGNFTFYVGNRKLTISEEEAIQLAEVIIGKVENL